MAGTTLRTRGGIFRRQCLEALGLSVTEAAKGLGVTRQALSDLINGSRATTRACGGSELDPRTLELLRSVLPPRNILP
jgi:predicted transcriptional regulator